MPKYRYLVVDTTEDFGYVTWVDQANVDDGDFSPSVLIDGYLKVVGRGDTLPELVTNMLERKL